MFHIGKFQQPKSGQKRAWEPFSTWPLPAHSLYFCKHSKTENSNPFKIPRWPLNRTKLLTWRFSAIYVPQQNKVPYTFQGKLCNWTALDVSQEIPLSKGRFCQYREEENTEKSWVFSRKYHPRVQNIIPLGCQEIPLADVLAYYLLGKRQ